MSEQILSLDEQQLWEIVSQMKALIEQDYAQARQMLIANPAIGLAVLKAQIRLGMVTVGSIQAVLANRPQAAPPPPMPPPQAPPPAMLPPVMPPQPPPQALPPPAAPTAEQAMIAQVMAMTPQQLAALPPEQRAQIEQLRRQFGVG